MVTRCGWALFAGAEPALLAASPAAAQERTVRFQIAAGPREAVLAAVAEQAGAALAWNGTPAGRAAAIRGSMPVETALARALAGSGFEARRAGPTAFRIVRVQPGPAPPRPPAATPVVSAAPLADIVITAQKRPQRLGDAAASIAVVHPDAALPDTLSPGTRAVAEAVEGFALTNLGPGRNRAFIRGIADSPFDGPSQSTVAVVLDQARVTFDAPDPDLRLVDLERVEVLKGPQGPLYGSGALGGVYRLVTRPPELGATGGLLRLTGQGIEGGAAGGGADAVLNLPIVRDALAVRAVGYLARGGGWIDAADGRRNANRSVIGGARLAVRWHPASGWSADLSGILQDVSSRDSQYVEAPAQRRTRLPEPSDNDFKSAALTVTGPVGGLTLLATSSYVHHSVDATFDATDAAAALGAPGTGRVAYLDERRYTIRNHEVRLSPGGSTRWLAGLSYLDAQSAADGTLLADRPLPIERRDRRVTETAAFAEWEQPLLPRVSAVVAARLSHTVAEDEAVERRGGATQRIGKLIVSPSAALHWRLSDRGALYARYARAVRPGGLAAARDGLGAAQFDADELGTLDLGYRWRSEGGALAASAGVFDTSWSDIQSDTLLTDGLVATRNAGRGAIRGAEASVDWQPRPATALSAGIGWADARLVRSATGLELEDSRLPVTPDLTARASLRRGFVLGAWQGSAGAQVNYLGRSRLSFDPGLDRRMGGYAVTAAEASLTRGPLRLGARIDNLLAVEGDSFAFGNPFSVRLRPQTTPLRPRTLTLTLTRGW